jgi:hypothetical protein
MPADMPCFNQAQSASRIRCARSARARTYQGGAPP